jgi:hypothetical protein
VVAGFADVAPSAVIDQEVVDDFFLLPAVMATLSANLPIAQMQSLESDAEAAVMARVEDENRKWLDEETEKLDAYSEDLQQAAELRIKALEAEVRAAKKALRMNSAISLTEKVQEQRRIKNLDAEVDELKMATFDRKKAIRAEIDQKLDAIASALQAVQLVSAIFTFRWTIRV